jgi:hypothetical protein
MRAIRAAFLSFCAGITAVPALASPVLIKAVVLRSTGTMFLGQTIWRELNTGWSQFGETPVQVDYTSLAGYDWTLQDIEATGANVLIFSAPGYMSYTQAEIDAVRQYVEAGRGLIYTYGLFLTADRALAPLVGLSESTLLASSHVIDPMYFEPVIPGHPLFARVTSPYVSGVPFQAYTTNGPWMLDGGTVVANMHTRVIPPDAGIITKDTSVYRGVYFSYYIEDKADGANQQDMQVFYSALLWAPEPGTLGLLVAGTALLLSRRGTRGPRR